MTDINEDNIDYSIMQFTPLPNIVGKIWLDSDDSEDEDNSDGPVIESWAKNDEDEDDSTHPVISFEEIEEIEEEEEYKKTYEYKQKHLYHPPTQADFKANNLNLSRNNNDQNLTDDSVFDDVNEFAILAENIEEPEQIVLGQKEQPQNELIKQNNQTEIQEKSDSTKNEIKNVQNQNDVKIELPQKKENSLKISFNTKTN